MESLLWEMRKVLRELRRQPDGTKAAVERRKIERCILILTNGMEQHPGDWDEACLCDLCRSYS